MANRSAALALASLAVLAIPITAYAAAEPPAKNSAYYTKKICSVTEAPTGSRLGAVRRCRTQAEDDERKSGSQNVTERMQGQKNFTEAMYGAGARGMCSKSLKC